MSGRFWIIIVIILVIFGGVLVANNNKNTAKGTGTATNHVEGKGNTGVKLVEYGDYECPYCEEYFPIVKQVAAAYNSQISFQFRNLPLTQIHPNAFAGARAAEAASLQGQFWEMHDLLYENQSQWVSASDPQVEFDVYAKALGLNTRKFDSDFAGTQVNNSIQADIAAFSKTGQPEATPTFFLDGKHITPTDTVNSFASYINAAIKQKTGKAPTAS
jgi:protein-disulfide isomerase